MPFDFMSFGRPGGGRAFIDTSGYSLLGEPQGTELHPFQGALARAAFDVSQSQASAPWSSATGGAVSQNGAQNNSMSIGEMLQLLSTVAQVAAALRRPPKQKQALHIGPIGQISGAPLRR